MDSHFRNSFAHRLAIAEVPDRGCVQSLRNARLRHTITQALQPFIELRCAKQSDHKKIVSVWIQLRNPSRTPYSQIVLHVPPERDR